MVSNPVQIDPRSEFINQTWRQLRMIEHALVYLYFYNWLHLYCRLCRLLDCLQDSEGVLSVSYGYLNKQEICMKSVICQHVNGDLHELVKRSTF